MKNCANLKLCIQHFLITVQSSSSAVLTCRVYSSTHHQQCGSAGVYLCTSSVVLNFRVLFTYIISSVEVQGVFIYIARSVKVQVVFIFIVSRLELVGAFIFIVSSRVRPFRLKKNFAYKWKEAKLDPFRMCFACSLEKCITIFALLFASFLF